MEHILKCKCCGKEFVSVRKSKVYCSEECWKNSLKKRLSSMSKNLAGKRFGRLVAIRSKNVNRRYVWLCRCDCGNEVWVQTANLLNGHSQSCGCAGREFRKENSSRIFSNYREKNYVDNSSISRLKSEKINTNNSSGVKGVYYHKRNKGWVAKLVFKGVTYSKFFKNKADAIAYRKELEEIYFIPYLKENEK